jgi:hypothetical protein
VALFVVKFFCASGFMLMISEKKAMEKRVELIKGLSVFISPLWAFYLLQSHFFEKTWKELILMLICTFT